MKMKNFFTLTRKAKGGFTLVELIVVIAILAILAGVAVPAYSGYVTKANKQADISLISEIEQALTLAGYSGTFNEEPSGYLILSADDEVQGVEEDSALGKALIATFGESYKDVLKLKYAEWGDNGVYENIEGMVGVAQSSYMTGNRKDVLLSDVEKMTSMAKDFTSAWGGNGLSFADLFGAEKLNATARQYGIGGDDWDADDWNNWGSEYANSNAYANLLVLTAADTYAKGEESLASNLILNFATIYGYAAVDDEFSETLDEYMDNLDEIDSDEDGKSWFEGLTSAAEACDGYSDYVNGVNGEVAQGEYDKKAFQTLLSAFGTPTDEQKESIAADMNNGNLFSSGVLNDMYNDYLNGMDAVMSMLDQNADLTKLASLGNGEVLVIYVLSDGILRISNSLPTT